MLANHSLSGGLFARKINSTAVRGLIDRWFLGVDKMDKSEEVAIALAGLQGHRMATRRVIYLPDGTLLIDPKKARARMRDAVLRRVQEALAQPGVFRPGCDDPTRPFVGKG